MTPPSRPLFPVLIVLTLNACGGGGDGGAPAPAPAPAPLPTTDQAPGGIFVGDINGCTTGCPFSMLMLVAEDGQWMSFDPNLEGGINVGQMTIDGATFTSTRKFYDGTQAAYGFAPTQPANVVTPADPRSFAGTLLERQSIEGRFAHNNSNDVVVTGNYNARYDNDSSLLTLAGTYSFADGSGLTVTYVIDDNGVVSGSDTTGCTADGQVQIKEPEFNLYDVSLTYTGCGPIGATGSYSGMASLLDVSGNEGIGIYGISDSEVWAVLLYLPRI